MVGNNHTQARQNPELVKVLLQSEQALVLVCIAGGKALEGRQAVGEAEQGLVQSPLLVRPSSAHISQQLLELLVILPVVLN